MQYTQYTLSQPLSAPLIHYMPTAIVIICHSQTLCAFQSPFLPLKDLHTHYSLGGGGVMMGHDMVGQGGMVG